MRDILTIIASVLILILAAALLAPPFIDWTARRDFVDGVIAHAAGTKARTDGPISIRLLPSPRLRIRRLRLGADGDQAPALTADFVTAEIALTPLLRGEVRFTETRIGRAEIRVPVSSEGGWRLPPELLSGNARARAWSIDNLAIAQFLVTTQKVTGRTDQFYAENVRIEGQKLIGPWRVEGVTAGVPFRFTTGELAPDKTLQVKLTGGGDIDPRFDIDAQVSLDESNGGTATPIAQGKAKLLFGPPAQVAAAGIPIPIAIETDFKTKAGMVLLDPFSLEAGEGGASLRLTGKGSYALGDPRIALKLEGRRLDADSFLLSSNGQDFRIRLAQWSLPLAKIPVDLDLKIDSIGLGQEDLANAVLQLSLDRSRAKIDRIEFTAPGETHVALQGEVGLTGQAGIEGRVALESQASDRLARYLDRLTIRSPFLKVLDGRPFEAASDISIASPVVSLSRLRVKTGDTILTGNLRYTQAEEHVQEPARGKLEAQVAIQGLDLDRLPQVSNVFEATQDLDVGFILDAHDVKAGTQPGKGRIAARILSDGPALQVEALDITDLAGANARMSGRIDPDGSGRIAGRITAPRAAPVIDLLGGVWIGGLSRFVPPFLREGALDLEVVSERAASPEGSKELRLRTTIQGQAAGGRLDSHVESAGGRTEAADIRLTTSDTSRWLGQTETPALNGSSTLAVKGARTSSGPFAVTLDGNLAGLKLTTARPFVLNADDNGIDGGEAQVNAADASALMVLLGVKAGLNSPGPLDARIAFGREADATLLDLSGQVAGSAIQGRLKARTRSDIDGNLTLDRLSLPWMVRTLVLGVPEADEAVLWPTARFGQSPILQGNPILTGGQISIQARTLDLGRGLQATNAAFTLAATPDGMSVNGLDAALGSGLLTASATITRQGTLASVVGEGGLRDVPLSVLVGSTPIQAHLTGSLKFGSAAESVSGLVANLGGAGDWHVTGIRIPAADPSAFERALKRMLAENEPLAEGRAEAVLEEELGRGPLSAADVSTTLAVVGGALRFSPFVIDGGSAVWQGAVGYDLKTLNLDARGLLTAKNSPPAWTGALPTASLNWHGLAAAPVREVDAGAFRSGLAAIVLKQELDRIDAFEKAAAERQRRAAEDAARQLKLKEDADRARIEAEKLQSGHEAAAPDKVQPVPPNPHPAFTMPPLTPPVEIAPPPRIQAHPGG